VVCEVDIYSMLLFLSVDLFHFWHAACDNPPLDIARKILPVGQELYGLELMVQRLGCRVHGLGLIVEGLGFRDGCLGCRVEG
jgi:hypothetical protein